MIYTFFIAAAMFFCSQTKSSDSFLQISNAPIVVGFGYFAYKTYEGYSHEDKKITLIQEAVNTGTASLIQEYDKEDETSLEVKRFLDTHKNKIDNLKVQKNSKNKGDSSEQSEKIITGEVSKKWIIGKLNQSANNALKNDLQILKLKDTIGPKTLLEIIATGQYALLHNLQKFLFNDSISHFLGRKMYNFHQKDSQQKAGIVGNIIWNGFLFCISLPFIAGGTIMVWLPCVLLYNAVRNVDLGFTIDKKYHSGGLGFLLERYFVKKR